MMARGFRLVVEDVSRQLALPRCQRAQQIANISGERGSGADRAMAEINAGQ